jgi:hypothetical protein
MSWLNELGKVVLGGVIGGPAGALTVFTVEHGQDVVECREFGRARVPGVRLDSSSWELACAFEVVLKPTLRCEVRVQSPLVRLLSYWLGADVGFRSRQVQAGRRLMG